jgi:hypothetical protein
VQKKPGNMRIAVFIAILLVLVGGLITVNLIMSRVPPQVVVDDDDHH